MIARTTLQGLRGDYSAIQELLQQAEGVGQALGLLDVFASLYLSMHAVAIDDGVCSCPGSSSASVCWHRSYWETLGGQRVSLGARLGSFPIPAEAARLYLGIGKTRRYDVARAVMQDTPVKRRRVNDANRGDASHASSSGAQGSGLQAGSSGSGAVVLPAFHVIGQFISFQTDSKVEYQAPAGLLDAFTAACDATRARGSEHVAFLLGGAVGEVTSFREVHIQITHLVFVPQVARAQTVDADLSALSTLLSVERDKHGPNLEVVGWIHDHHSLPDEPTIQYDCMAQYSFQKDNPYFVMLITGLWQKGSRRQAGDEWSDATNWFSWYSLTGKSRRAIEEVQRKFKRSETQKARLVAAMGHECPITDYVRKLSKRQRKDPTPIVTLSKTQHALIVLKPESYLTFEGNVGGSVLTAAALDNECVMEERELIVSDACEMILSSFEILSAESMSAWAAQEDLQQCTGLSASVFDAALLQCLQHGKIAVLCGYVRPLQHPVVKELPSITGSCGTDLYRLIKHIGACYVKTCMIPSSDIKWIPLSVVRYLAEHHLQIPLEIQFSAWLEHLVAVHFVELDGQRVSIISTADDVLVASRIVHACTRPTEVDP